MTYNTTIHDTESLRQHLIVWLQDCFERIPYADEHEDYMKQERQFKAAWEALETLGEQPGDYL